MKRLTRHYVRRQANWFKEEDDRIHWFEVGPNLLDEMVKEIQRYLNQA
jgi:tRNA A37 N6-isopentenylltransferase MiaA